MERASGVSGHLAARRFGASGKLERALLGTVLVGVTCVAPVGGQTFDEVIREEIVIPTRYGENLRAQLAFPAVDGNRALGAFPVTLRYTPYCAETPTNTFARAGYVNVTVWWPGTCGSEGRLHFPGDHFSLSGYDAVEWLATQPWSTGKVGLHGGSAPGIALGHVAASRPPHLATIIPLIATSDPYEDSIYRGGMLNVTDTAVFHAILYAQWYGDGVVERLKDPESAERMLANGWFYPEDHSAEWLAHPTKDDYWQRLTMKLDQIDIPVWSMGNWDDFFPTGNERLYTDVASDEKMFTMGANGHAFPGPGFDGSAESLRWFDYWLKGIDDGIGEELETARFRYYVLQEFVWKTASDYPVPGTSFTNWYLAAETPMPGLTGTLSPSFPPDENASDTFVYQPTQGRHNGQAGYVPGGLLQVNGPERQSPVYYNEPAYAGDQRLEADTLTYASEPLEEDVEVTGPITMTLVASSTSDDTDWVVKLVDVFPEDVTTDGPQAGYWNLVTTGRLKGTHRNGHVTPEPIPVGEQVAYDITLWPTSYLFRARHRIALQIASADASRSLVNPRPAVNTVFHTSHVTLPIVPR